MGFTEVNTLPFLLLLSFLSFGVLASAIALSIKAYRYHSRTCTIAAALMFFEIYGISMILCDSVFGEQMNQSFSELLVPVHLIEGYIAFIPFMSYLMELKRPGWLSWKRLPVTLPVVILSIPLCLHPEEYTHLYTIPDIFLYGDRPDVILRIILGVMFVIYGVIPFLFPNKDKDSGLPKSSSDFIQMLTLVLSFTFLIGMHLNIYPVTIFHSLLLFTYNIIIVYTELRVRIPAKIDATPQKPAPYKNGHPYFDNPDIWMDPEISAEDLARRMGTNQKYMLEQIKACGYAGYNDMINRKRVEYICNKLDKVQGGRADIVQLLFDAGFRSRSTANSEFKRITGLSPTEYFSKNHQ